MIEKHIATIEVPFIHHSLENFSKYKKDIVKCVVDEAVPNIFERNLKCLRTPWHIIKFDCIKWLADQMVALLYEHDKLNEGTFVVDEIWGALYEGKNGAKLHKHYPASWSTVTYIDCPIGSGQTVWPDIQKNITPVDGDVCIFPGWLNHYAQPSQDGVRRIIVSCNIYPKRRNN